MQEFFKKINKIFFFLLFSFTSFSLINAYDIQLDVSVSSPPHYVITVSPSPSTGGVVSGGGTYIENTEVVVNAEANSGYVFKNWSEGDTEVSSRERYVFSANMNRDLVANFEFIDGEDVVDEEDIEKEKEDIEEEASDDEEIVVTQTTADIDDEAFGLKGLTNISLLLALLIIPITILSLFSNQFAMHYSVVGLGIKRKKKGRVYAVAYDSNTKKPIKKAIMKIYDKKGKLIHMDMSNSFGEFNTEVPFGNYKIVVFAEGYSASSDFEGGVEFKIDKEDTKYSVFLTPLNTFSNRLVKVLGILQPLLIFLGFGFALVVYFLEFSLIHFIILSIYIPLIIILLLSFFENRKNL